LILILAEDMLLPEVKELVQDLIPELNFKLKRTGQVHLAMKLEEMYNDVPTYHQRKRIDFRFVCFAG